jgi:hypothetical protein
MMKMKHLILLGLMCVGPATAEEDLLLFDEAQEKPSLSGDEKNYTVTVEVFSVPILKAAEMKRSRKNHEILYQELVKNLNDGKVVLKKFMEIRGSEGMPFVIEQGREYIYPTEYDPPVLSGLPRALPKDFKDYDKFINPATPRSFEREILGEVVELLVKSIPNQDDAVTTSFTFSHTSLESAVEWGQDEAKIKLPQFERQKIETAMTVVLEKPHLAGSLANPSKSPDQKDSIWQVFLTISGSDAEKK